MDEAIHQEPRMAGHQVCKYGKTGALAPSGHRRATACAFVLLEVVVMTEMAEMLIERATAVISPRRIGDHRQ